MYMLRLKFLEQVLDQFRFRYKQGRSDQSMPVLVTFFEKRKQVLGIEYAHNFIETVLVHRQPGIMKILHFFDQVMERHVVVNSIYIQSEFHDLSNRDVTEFDNAL